MKTVCSQCNRNDKELLRETLNYAKMQLVQSIIGFIPSLLSNMIADQSRLRDSQVNLTNLDYLHHFLAQSSNLHAFQWFADSYSFLSSTSQCFSTGVLTNTIGFYQPSTQYLSIDHSVVSYFKLDSNWNRLVQFKFIFHAKVSSITYVGQ